MSADGSILCYKITDPLCNGTNVVPGIYVQEIASGATHLITQKMDGSPASFIEVATPALSPDDHLVAFESFDDGIVTNDLNQASDIFLRDWAISRTVLVSQAKNLRPANTGAGMSSLWPNGVSADGQMVVFTSFDSSLARRDTNQWQDAFVKDLQTGDIIPISIVPEVIHNPPPYGSPADEWTTNAPFPFYFKAYDPVISRNGQYAAWVWRSSIYRTEDVYLRDLVLRTNFALVTLNSRDEPSFGSSHPVLNNTGDLLVFQSAASNMVDYLTVGPFTNIYVRDLLAGTNQLVSVSWNGLNSGNGHSIDPQLSPDGQWILFRSTARNLTTNYVDGAYFLYYARNLNTRLTRLVSPGPPPFSFYREPRSGEFTTNSRFVFYAHEYYGGIIRHDLLAQTNLLVVPPSSDFLFNDLSASADGRWLVHDELSYQQQIIYLKDIETGQTFLISSNFFDIWAYVQYPISTVITPDARFIIFTTKATNFNDIPLNGVGDIYVRDRLLGTTILASINRFGTAGGNGKSSKPILAADGRTVVFQSFASDLVEGDFNETQDIFVLRLGGVDSDSDGMDDDWEIAYFSDLSHDGTADGDGDGRTDLQEFLSGTDPTNGGSVLRVMTLTMPGNTNTTILWSAVPGRTYQVQFKTNVTDAGWLDVPGTVTATGSTGAKVDSAANTSQHRFYRVLWQP